jgi:hypothetical protein
VIRLDKRQDTLYAHFYLGLVYLHREMYEDAQTFFQKISLGPNLIEAHYELGRAFWFGGDGAGAAHLRRGIQGQHQSVGRKCRETLELVGQGQEPPRP